MDHHRTDLPSDHEPPRAGRLADGAASGRSTAAGTRGRTSDRESWAWLPFLGILGAVYLLTTWVLPGRLEGGLNIYLAQPAAWSIVSVAAWMGWRELRRPRDPSARGIVPIALLLGAFQVSIWLLAGLIFGFGHSPYGHQPGVLLGNVLYAASVLVAMEAGRAFLVRSLSPGGAWVAVVSVSLLFSVVSIPATRWSSTIHSPQTFLEFFGQDLLPATSESLLATSLALVGGPAAAVAYRGLPLAFEWLSPALPRLTWSVTAYLGTMAPILGMLALHDQLFAGDGRRERGRAGVSTAWLIPAFAAATLVWFNTGLFGVQPTLVSGVSMEPALHPGDIAITQPTPSDSIEVGDIVRFRLGGIHVLHRVVEIEEAGTHRVFVTKGDANNVLDRPRLESEIEGRVVLVVPRLGWIGILVRDLLGAVR